jgi:hypothetical protein
MLLSSLTSAWRDAAAPPVRIPQPAMASPPVYTRVESLLPPAPMIDSFYERARLTMSAIMLPDQRPRTN